MENACLIEVRNKLRKTGGNQAGFFNPTAVFSNPTTALTFLIA
jgi:hypothetical protein